MTMQMDFTNAKGSAWYKGDLFTNAHLVTDKASNLDLGIRDIRFSQPRGTHARVIANVVIELDTGINGVQLYGTIYLARNGKDLTFGVEQREYVKDDKSKGYADVNVRIPLEMQAQVLRHAATRMVEKAVAPAVTVPAGPTAAQIAVAEAQKAMAEAKAVAEAEAVPSIPGVVEESVPLSAEQIARLLEGATTPEEKQAIVLQYLS